MKNNRSHIVIKKAFARLQRSNPKFSIRALALKIGVSHVFMMKLLKGEASIPDKKIGLLIKVLALDDLAKSELKEAILYDTVKDKLKAFSHITDKKKLAADSFEEYPSKYLSVLKDWYNLPILDLLTCKISPKNPWEISKILGIKEHEVLLSLELMKDMGLASYRAGEWKKTNANIRFPMNIPTEITKNYYKSILNKASEELNHSNVDRYAKRSITNLSIAVNPEKIQAAKEKLQACLYDIAKEMSEGDCQEVYFLTTCLYPLTKP